MANSFLLAMSGSMTVVAVSVCWLLMHSAMLFGNSRSSAARDIDRIPWRCEKNHKSN